jgi:hypothetical protein
MLYAMKMYGEWRYSYIILDLGTLRSIQSLTEMSTRAAGA